MKRFLLFGGESFYARGGANDFIASFNAASEAMEAGEALCEFYEEWSISPGVEWYHVVDGNTMERVGNGDRWPHGEYH